MVYLPFAPNFTLFPTYFVNNATNHCHFMSSRRGAEMVAKALQALAGVNLTTPAATILLQGAILSPLDQHNNSPTGVLHLSRSLPLLSTERLQRFCEIALG